MKDCNISLTSVDGTFTYINTVYPSVKIHVYIIIIMKRVIIFKQMPVSLPGTTLLPAQNQSTESL